MKTMALGEPPLVAKANSPARPARAPRRGPPAAEALQLRTLLVPLDFSEASLRALRSAIPLAEKFGASLHLVHVQPTDELTAIARAGHFMLDAADSIALMQDRLAEVREAGDAGFWPDNCHVLSGRPDEEICRLAREIAADLIVLPTRGHSGLRHILLGSTAERIVRHAPCPVLVLHGVKARAAKKEESPADFAPRKILVPTDFSKTSLTGVRYAARLARSTGAELRLLHVVYPYGQVIWLDRAGADSKSLVETATAAAEKELGELKAMKFLRGLSCATDVQVGSAIDVITGESSRPEVDLLVVSTHGRSGLKRALLGSVAEHVVRYSECPVITVPGRRRS